MLKECSARRKTRFWKDRDPPLPLERVRIHDRALALAERVGPGLLEERVDERGLSVINVRDDRHVRMSFLRF